MSKYKKLLERVQDLENQNKELTQDTTSHKHYVGHRMQANPIAGFSMKPMFHEHFTPTIRGELNAIKKHLGITVRYAPEQIDKKITSEGTVEKKTFGRIVVEKYVIKPKAKKASK